MPSTPRRGTAGKDARPTPQTPSASRPTARRVARAAQGTGNREPGTGNRDPLTRAATAFVAAVRRRFEGSNPPNHAMFTWTGESLAHFKTLAKACGMALVLLVALVPLVGCQALGGPSPTAVVDRLVTVVVEPAVSQAVANGLQELQAQGAAQAQDPAIEIEFEGSYAIVVKGTARARLAGVAGQLMLGASAAPPRSGPTSGATQPATPAPASE